MLTDFILNILGGFEKLLSPTDIAGREFSAFSLIVASFLVDYRSTVTSQHSTNPKGNISACKVIIINPENPTSRSQNRSTPDICVNFSSLRPIDRAASPQVRGVGKIFVGLANPWGLNTCRTQSMVSKSVSENISDI